MKDRQQHEQELVTLKVIAETLNRSTDLTVMLQSVLEELLNVTGLKTGWIFLTSEKMNFTCAADSKLPQALSQNDKQLMCHGSCWCLNRYWDGRLKQAVNIIECKRLEDATNLKIGDTEGLTHHATVPLTAAGESFGVLNVGSPGKEQFSDEELTLLESVAFQIGTAIKRTRLFQSEQKRGQNFSKLETITRELWNMERVDHIIDIVVKSTGNCYEWPFVGFFINEGNDIMLSKHFINGEVKNSKERYTERDLPMIKQALHEQESNETSNKFIPYPDATSTLSLPVSVRDEHIGVLVASKKESAFEKSEIEVTKAIADHMALAIEHVKINYKKQELLLSDERNRLARDLHDSVSQKLFSLSMTAKGARSTQQEENPVLTDALKDIQQLAQDAMREMRTLIWQLRPSGMEAGLLTSLKSYAIGLGLEPQCDSIGIKELPRFVEEALWRIGQEALNNVRNHAKVKEVRIILEIHDEEVSLTIQDSGQGFDPALTTLTLGIQGMKERTDLLNGTLTITSSPKQGTAVNVVLPIMK
ncbi:GAF domain-containing sensor histidine kinase [Guptibacillus algicola]|uniref:GAF domain-containing sensor histidine kinase n=1 Tax=Guptibacillus algicola TaxID=225844 RepID=UPI001CD32B5E|nr:GAF domain-containing protein [Alkalihalobacillus algicola]MCA0989068.1 GAF domain-containing protein [Alkalihalobacillus algicola]